MTTELQIKTIDSYVQIEEVMRCCGSDFFDQRLNNETDIARLAEKFAARACFLAAYAEGETAGFLSYYCNDETKAAYISMIITKRAHQGQGVGSVLLKHMIEDCTAKGQKQIRLEVANRNEKAVGFYTKKGFTREGQASEVSDYYCLEL